MIRTSVKANKDLIAHITKEVKKAQKTTLSVGIINAGTYEDGTPVTAVAAMHEFGAGVPKRSFLKMPFEVKQKELKKAFTDGYNGVLMGKYTAKTAMSKVGLVAQGISKNAIKEQGYGNWKPLKEATVSAKGGKSKILFDTGRLVQSITYKVNQ